MATYKTSSFSLARCVWRPLALWVFIRLFQLLDRKPRVARGLMFCLRLRPVWYFGGTVLVIGDRQVHDVLTRDDDFPLAEKRAAKFPTGAFVLGMTRTPQFERERGDLTKAVKHGNNDRERISELAEVRSQQLIEAAQSTGRLDVVDGLSTPVGMVLTERYFGVPEYEDTTHYSVLDDLRLLGAMVASPCSELDRFRALAERAAVRVFEHVGDQIDSAERISEPEMPTASVLQRLVFHSSTSKYGFDRETVRRNLTGVLLPGSALVTRAFATSLVQIMKKSELREIALGAVERCQYRLLERCILEALRFHPVFPLVPRYCPRDTVLPGFKRHYRIKAGRDVYLSLVGAMFDPHAALFDGAAGGRPADVRIREPQHYRHFGGGAHECLGKHIALPQMARMLFHVLRLPDLHVGTIEYNDDDGISPKSLRVTFSAVPKAQGSAEIMVPGVSV